MKLPDDILQDISEKLAALGGNPVDDIKTNAQALVSGLLAKLDLVTQEEFDVQARVLARTREKVERLEQQVNALEQKLEQQP
jgi:BMFP domain-containing protein YqiC